MTLRRTALASLLALSTGIAAAPAFADATYPSALIWEATGKTGRIQGNVRVRNFSLSRGKGGWSIRIEGEKTQANAKQGVDGFYPSCVVKSTDREEILALYSKVNAMVKEAGTMFGCLGTPIGNKPGGGTNTVDLTGNGEGSFDIRQSK